MTEYRYKAFISYSHLNEPWASWLQKQLESYRVPKRLVGQVGSFGPISERLGKVFRDREDLPSAVSLTDSVRNALAEAETLIVICSPAAAGSRWVNEEIKSFRALGRGDRIYALIVDGDPQSSDPSIACFPESLVTSEDGEKIEPLAADVRKWADGKLLSKQKLVAGIFGIRLDDLRRRDMQRLRRSRFMLAMISSIIILVTTVLSVTTFTTRKSAQQRRANTEELLSYMFGRLESLSPVSGLDIIDEGQQEVSDLASQHSFEQLTETEVMEKAQNWRQEGLSFRDLSDTDKAMQAFKNSHAALVYLYQIDPENREYLFELGQAEFWVGNEYWENHDLDKTEEAFTRYGVITRRLLNAEPTNADYVMELSYTLTNLAGIKAARESVDPNESIQLMQAALEYHQLALVLEPDAYEFKLELPGTQAYLADAWLGVCNLGKAYRFRDENVKLSREFLAQSPAIETLEAELAYALSGMAVVQQNMGLIAQALDNLHESEMLLSGLVNRFPENTHYRRMQRIRQTRIAHLLAASGDEEAAWELTLSLSEAIPPAVDITEEYDNSQQIENAEIYMLQSTLALDRGDHTLAKAANVEAIAILEKIVRNNPDLVDGNLMLAAALVQYWFIQGEPPSPQLRSLVEDYSLSIKPIAACNKASLAAQQAMMRGDKKIASDYTDYLLEKGFYEPFFIKFCRDYKLCQTESNDSDRQKSTGVVK